MNMSTSFQAATSATPGSPQHHVPRQLPSAIFTRVAPTPLSTKLRITQTTHAHEFDESAGSLVILAIVA